MASYRATTTAVATERGPGGLVVRLSGVIDVHTATDLRITLHQIIDADTGPLLLDLSDAVVSDTTGLGLLVECHRRGRRLGREMHLMAPDERCERMLRRLHLGRLFGPRAARATV